jgi:hypothetical protein
MFSFTIDYNPSKGRSEPGAVISVGAGRSQISLIRAIKSAGYTCVAFDRDGNAPGSALADYFFECSTHDADAAIAQLSKLEIAFKAVMVKAAGQPVVTAAKIARQFHLDFPSPRLAESIIWKDGLVDFARLHQIRVAETHVNVNGNVPDDFFPAVLRPNRDIRGRETSYLIHHKRELRRRLLDNPQPHGHSLSRYIDGRDLILMIVFDASRKNWRGLWFHERNTFESDGSISFAGFTPTAETNESACQQAMDIVEKVVRFSGAWRGCMMFSFRVTADHAVYLIEIHPDLGGEGLLEEIIPNHFGQPFLEDLVRFYAGDLLQIKYLPKVFLG